MYLNLDNTIKIIHRMENLGMFGEESFFSRKHTQHGIKAVNVVSLVYITYEDF
jgi:hypothetical protein